MSDLENQEKHIQIIEEEVKVVVRDILARALSANKAVILQTLAIIIALVTLVVAAERRMTTIEVKTTLEIQARVEQDQAMLSAIQRLQDATTSLAENQVRVVTLLDGIEKRHDIADHRKINAAGGVK